MNTRELVRRVGRGLKRRDIYYLESQGFITSFKYRAGNTWRRDWAESLVPILRRYIDLKKEVFKVGAAWERAQEGSA